MALRLISGEMIFLKLVFFILVSWSYFGQDRRSVTLSFKAFLFTKTCARCRDEFHLTGRYFTSKGSHLRLVTSITKWGVVEGIICTVAIETVVCLRQDRLHQAISRKAGFKFSFSNYHIVCYMKTREPSQSCYLTHRKGEKRWTNAFPKCICVKVNVTNTAEIRNQFTDFSSRSEQSVGGIRLRSLTRGVGAQKLRFLWR